MVFQNRDQILKFYISVSLVRLDAWYSTPVNNFHYFSENHSVFCIPFLLHLDELKAYISLIFSFEFRRAEKKASGLSIFKQG